MRKWEEIVKDKLEGYESPLPEGHLADFRARREQACKPRRRFPWVGAVALAVAASLSAFLFLWKPAVPEGNIRVAESMPNPGLLVSDSAEVSRPLTRPVWSGAQASDGEVSTAENRGVQALAGKTSEAEARQAAAASETVPPSDTAEAAAHAEAAANAEAAARADATAHAEAAAHAEASEITAPASPFVPQGKPARPVRLTVGAATGAVAGGGLLAGVLIPLVSNRAPAALVINPQNGNGTNGPDGPDSTPGGNGGNGTGTDGPDSTPGGNGGNGTTPDPPSPTLPETPVGQNAATHYFPLKLGLSVRIPLSERLQITTGLQYSLYSSAIPYGPRQNAHYLGIPVRLDWTLAQGRWIDVYLGGGLEGDLCIGATLAGHSFRRDGPSLSLLGAGGIQLNLSRHIGLFVEPEVSWRLPLGTTVLETYRSTHPLMFSVASGIRINLK